MPPISARHLLNRFRFTLRLFHCGYNFPRLAKLRAPRCGLRSRIVAECSAVASNRRRICENEITAMRRTLVSLEGDYICNYKYVQTVGFDHATVGYSR